MVWCMKCKTPTLHEYQRYLKYVHRDPGVQAFLAVRGGYVPLKGETKATKTSLFAVYKLASSQTFFNCGCL
jgi:hypothetical protein